MRCFIAIDIDGNIKGQIGSLQEQLQKQTLAKPGQVKWVDPSGIHLTLKFMGEVKDAYICQVCKAVEDAAKQYSGFSIDIKGMGCFGKSPRVLWVGAQGGQQLAELQSAIENNLFEAGWAKERRKFSGHLTICRIKNSQLGRMFRELVEGYGPMEMGQLQVDSVCVYRSDLTSEGPIYTPIARYSLTTEF